MQRAFRLAFGLGALALATVACGAHAAALAKDTRVRVQASGIEPGWHEGRVGIAGSACTMILLDAKTKSGYTMVSLHGAAQLQRKEGAGWVDVPVKALAAEEPKACHGDND